MVGAIHRGDVWWADLSAPRGASPGVRRPLLVVQADAFTAAGLGTVVAVPLTSDVALATHASCVELAPATTGLPRAAVALVHQVHAVHRARLVALAGRVAPAPLEGVLRALDLVLGR